MLDTKRTTIVHSVYFITQPYVKGCYATMLRVYQV